MRERLAGGGGGGGLLTRTILDGQGYEMNKGSHPANKQDGVMKVKGGFLVMCRDMKEGPSPSTSAEAEGCSHSPPPFAEQDLMLLVVSVAKPFKYPLLTLTWRSHRRSPRHRGTSRRRAVQLFRPSFSHQHIQTRTRYETEPQDTKRAGKQIRTRQQVAAPDSERVTSQPHRSRRQRPPRLSATFNDQRAT